MGIYSERPKTDILFALVLWLFDLICLYIMGAHSDNSWIYWSLGLLPTIIVIIAVIAHDNSLEPLGFCKTNLKTEYLYTNSNPCSTELSGSYMIRIIIS